MLLSNANITFSIGNAADVPKKRLAPGLLVFLQDHRLIKKRVTLQFAEQCFRSGRTIVSQNMFCLSQAKDTSQTPVSLVAKLTKILLHKQNFNVYQAMLVCLAEAFKVKKSFCDLACMVATQCCCNLLFLKHHYLSSYGNE